MPDRPINDADRRMYYIQVLTAVSALAETFPGGYVGALIGMAVGLGRIDWTPPNVSTLADTVGLTRPTIRRYLRLLEEAGVVHCERDESGQLRVHSCFDGAHLDQFQKTIDELIRGARYRLGVNPGRIFHPHSSANDEAA
jgi:DNA-binding transcriptional ArsR family regulator